MSRRLALLGVDLDPQARLAELSIAQRRMVEICKAVMQDAQVIAFDEPASSLSHHETDILFRIVRDPRADGRTLIYISHRLEDGKDNIRVNTLTPGWVMAARQIDQWVDSAGERAMDQNQCLPGRIGGADVASMARFLGARGSRMMTAREFVVDAGWT